MAELRFKPDDPLNPCDPASLSLGEQGVFDRIKAGQSPLSNPAIQAMLSHPAQRENLVSALVQTMKQDAEERARTGESVMDQIKREKAEWAAADARAAALKAQGNAAFSQGDFKQAFLVYSACAMLSPHEPVYTLNRSAAALKLGCFEQAEQDAGLVLRFGTAKAYFRRAQARKFLGNLGGADEDLVEARKLQPGDKCIEEEMNEVRRLKGLSEAELRSWVTAQGATRPRNIYGSTKAMEARIEELTKG
ncbi:putative response to arachidonic acid [Lyophyllum shimeji]|uniref:Response to arachidonic acid n=1 Tax=Lyophyllum shimeji TaxID=47721 RepID=A0A9P3UP66_LYOSH|nr:putative response to arachidonic acid [Lyophyllum shimeji]